MRLINKFALLVCSGILLCACAAAPPTQTHNLCLIFNEKDDWYDSAKSAVERWGGSIPSVMAIMERESAYRADAKPARTWYLGFIPGSRPSSAEGYAQALDGTWAWYQRSTGNSGADRDDFADAVDFIAWYNYQSRRILGLRDHQAKKLYYAYHEGHGGYKRGTYKNKRRLRRAASDVQRTRQNYANQFARCKDELESKRPWWWPF